MNQAALELLIQLKDEASKGISNIGGALSSIGGMAVAGVAVAGAAIGGFLISAVSDAAEAQDKLAQLEQTVKSTGGAAGMTTGELTDLASALQKTTKFSDDQVIAGESILLTFTGIGKDVFPDVTKMTLDMAQALGTDTKSAAMQLGKALNDPVAGLSALSRSGVSFSEAQKDMIKSMVKAGDVAGAQKLMLAELNKEFGGSAEAAGKTFSGQLAIAKNMLGEFGEMIGGKILPIITPLISRVIQLATDGLPKVEAALGPVMDALSNFGEYIGLVIDDGDTLNDFLANLPEPIQPIVQAIGEIIAAFITFTQYMGLVIDDGDTLNDFLTNLPEPLQPIAQAFGEAFIAVQEAIGNVVDWVVANWPLIQATIATVIGVIISTVLPMLITGFSTVIEIVKTVIATFIQNWPLIQATVTTVINAIATNVLPVLITAFNSVISVVRTVIASFIENWPMIQATVATVINTIVTNVLPVLITGLNGMLGIVQQIVGWVVTNWPLIQATVSTVITAISNVIQVALPIILSIFQTVFPIIYTVVSTAISAVLAVITATMQFITGDTTAALNTLAETFGSIWERIKALVTTAVTALRTVVATGMANVKTEILNKLNESVLFLQGIAARFIEAGQNMIQGLWSGISGMGNWFRDKFRAWLAANLPEWAQKLLGIHSPSLVAAQDIGVPFVQGIVQGMESELPKLRSAVMNIARQMMAASSIVSSSALGSAASAAVNAVSSAGSALGSAASNAVSSLGSLLGNGASNGVGLGSGGANSALGNLAGNLGSNTGSRDNAFGVRSDNNRAIHVTVYADVANDVDIDELAYAVAKKVNAKRF